jgi:hypothetical protein
MYNKLNGNLNFDKQNNETWEYTSELWTPDVNTYVNKKVWNLKESEPWWIFIYQTEIKLVHYDWYIIDLYIRIMNWKRYKSILSKVNALKIIIFNAIYHY